MDSSNLNIFTELSSLGEDNSSFNLKRRRDSREGTAKKNMPRTIQGRSLLSTTKTTNSSTSTSTTLPPSNPTTHTTTLSNVHPLTPTRTVPPEISPTLSNPTPMVTISRPVPAPKFNQDTISSLTQSHYHILTRTLPGKTETRPSCQ